MRKYTKETMWEVRDFLQQTYQDKKINWMIDRLNFTFSFSRIMNGVSEETYIDKLCLFEEDGHRAITMTEGEDRGEAFIAFDSYEFSKKTLEVILDHIEAEMTKEEAGLEFVNLRVPSDYKQLIDLVEERGYKKLEWSEITSDMILDGPLDVELPEGYAFVAVSDLSYEQLAKGHAYAFGYINRPEVVSLAEEGLQAMQQMPDYNPAFDIQVVKDHEVVAFATMWLDNINNVGILEPVGTHPEHRRKGLAQMAIYEACNRIFNTGIRKVFVGSDMAFYQAIGFKYHSEDYVYKRIVKDV